MNAFTYQYPVTVYFGEKTAEKNLPAELAKVGKTVMLAYGGGSVKKNGIYDELVTILKAAGKEIVEHAQSHLRKGAGGCKACKGKQGGFHPRRGRRLGHRLL